MATKDGLNPHDFLLLFLSGKPLSVTDEPEQQGTWLAGLLAWSGHWLSAGWLLAKLVLRFIRKKAALVLSGVHGFFARWVKDFGNDDRAVAVASILLTTATATGIAVLSTANPVTLFADVTASLADKSAPQPSTDQSTPIIQSVVIQSTADAEAPPTAQDVPTREINAPEPASQTKKENDEASLEALFREFQAWSAEQDARDLAKPLQIHPAPVVKNASASARPKQKQQAQTIRNAKQTQSRSFLSELLSF
jgi:hypothetical protein